MEEFQGGSRGLRQICAVPERFSDFWRRLREFQGLLEKFQTFREVQGDSGTFGGVTMIE